MEVPSASAIALVEDLSETVAAVAEIEGNGELKAIVPLGESESVSTNVWNDDAAESAFRAEARDRGESLSAPRTEVEPDVADGKDLPSVDDLVKRLSPEVRDVLDDLFRAKFTTVRRVPVKAFKT